MFPIDQATLDYDQGLLEKYDSVANPTTPLRTLLPEVRRAGQSGGILSSQGAARLGLPEGIPIAPAEGDQPAALAGSLIGEAGMISCSFGTSVCANSVGDRSFSGVSKAVDHFCAPDGKPINMVWLRNGTTFMNSVVEMFGQAIGGSRGDGFEKVIPMLLDAAPDCGGIMALPFMDDEPGINVHRGGTAMLVGLNSDNATPGNVVKAALLATMFNLRLGCEILDGQGFPRTELVLSGGLTKTPELAQLLADVFANPVTLLESAEEGTAWGAALMAKYRSQVLQGAELPWSEFLGTHATGSPQQYQPKAAAITAYEGVYQQYKKLIDTQPAIDKAINN
jgi:sugar (pentulose or hexulose) kinase